MIIFRLSSDINKWMAIKKIDLEDEGKANDATKLFVAELKQQAAANFQLYSNANLESYRDYLNKKNSVNDLRSSRLSNTNVLTTNLDALITDTTVVPNIVQVMDPTTRKELMLNTININLRNFLYL